MTPLEALRQGINKKIIKKIIVEDRIIDIYEKDINELWQTNAFENIHNDFVVIFNEFLKLWHPFLELISKFHKDMAEGNKVGASVILKDYDLHDINYIIRYYEGVNDKFKELYDEFINGLVEPTRQFIRKEVSVINKEISDEKFEEDLVKFKLSREGKARKDRLKLLYDLAEEHKLSDKEDNLLNNFKNFIEKDESMMGEIKKKLNKSTGRFKFFMGQVSSLIQSSDFDELNDINWSEIDVLVSQLSELADINFIKKEFKNVLSVIRTRFIVPFRNSQNLKKRYIRNMKRIFQNAF